MHPNQIHLNIFAYKFFYAWRCNCSIMKVVNLIYDFRNLTKHFLHSYHLWGVVSSSRLDCHRFPYSLQELRQWRICATRKWGSICYWKSELLLQWKLFSIAFECKIYWLWYNLSQVNKAISTDNAQRQWVSLGNLSVACLTKAQTCGSAGGALSVWIKLGATDYPTGGIISSFDYSEGFQVFVYNNALR